jgi:hypothetical protein
MRDPHVVALHYTATPSNKASFDNAPPLEAHIDGFALRLHEGKLTLTPSSHFGSAEEAMAAAAPLLRAWEIDIALRFGNPELSFSYESADLVDRDPPPPGTPQTIQVQSASFLLMSGRVTPRVSRISYPDPPSFFRTSPDVETLWQRFQGYRAGREPLPSMAYFCLTVVETIAGGRPQAAQMLNISANILSTVGRLTSQRGDPSIARKYSPSMNTPLTGAEVRWLEEATKAIIRRLGELTHVATLPIITMTDLPAI